MKRVKKAGVFTTVIIGSIEIGNGAIQDYKNYTTTGSTNGKNTAVATGSFFGGVLGGGLAGAATGALFVVHYLL